MVQTDAETGRGTVRCLPVASVRLDWADCHERYFAGIPDVATPRQCCRPTSVKDLFRKDGVSATSAISVEASPVTSAEVGFKGRCSLCVLSPLSEVVSQTA